MTRQSKDWRLVKFQSIFSTDIQEGYLTTSGDIMCWWEGVIPAGWVRLAAKNEVKEIIKYLDC